MNNVTILAHNYVRGSVQEIADFVGDSLELAKKVRDIDTDYIAFAGVDFMAEMAAILNPEKKVIHPEPHSKCAMAMRLSPSDILKVRERYPSAAVVTYVNSSAAVKAVSDIICTSSNAVDVVNSLDSEQIIFAPDRNLAAFVAKRSDKTIIPVPVLGCCPVHHALSAEDVKRVMHEYPEGKVIVHPETTQEVQALADYIGSTSSMIRYARESEAETIIVGTENGILARMKREAPNKKLIPASPLTVCPDMKMLTVEKVIEAINRERPIVRVGADVAEGARRALERMMDL